MQFLSTIYHALLGTPWWVWVLFAWLLYRGVTALKPRIVSLRSLLIVPVILVGLGMHALLKNETTYPSIIWASTLSMGVAFGWILVSRIPIGVDKERSLLKLPGSAITMIIILIFFGMKYALGYVAATQPELVETVVFVTIKYIVYGLSTGVLVGRTCWYIYRYVKSSHSDFRV